MVDVRLVATYRGRALTDMTREELMEAVEFLGRAYNEAIKCHLSERGFRREVDAARRDS